MNNNQKSIQKYCVGCGLCKSVNKETVLEKDDGGFFHPIKFDYSMLHLICPAAGNHSYKLDRNNIWGRSHGVYRGYSTDLSTRHLCSSGGILTELSSYLLENGIVDVVIHTKADSDRPTETVTCYSKTRDELLEGAGSRYSISHPLNWLSKLECGKKYAFIGKPCDVVALRNYIEVRPKLKSNFLYLFSFFCMGIPSVAAQKKLLERLGCNNGCEKLTYRGNGWPGYTVAVDNNNESHSIDYDSSWGKILGRDLMPACRFCIDGIGEMADISCGDAWYIKDGKPDFSEHEGRNVVFARTQKGLELLRKVQQDGNIFLEPYEDFDRELPIIQKSQFTRRQSMKYRIAAMKLCLKPHPRYDSCLMNSYSSGYGVKNIIKTFVGTAKRVITHKM